MISTKLYVAFVGIALVVSVAIASPVNSTSSRTDSDELKRSDSPDCLLKNIDDIPKMDDPSLQSTTTGSPRTDQETLPMDLKILRENIVNDILIPLFNAVPVLRELTVDIDRNED